MMDPIHPAKDFSNGASTPRELFALTDEQILEIGPQGTNDGAGVEQPLLAVSGQNAGEDHAIQNSGGGDRSSASALSEVAERPVQSREAVLPVEPPPWLAHMMADPRSGAEARDLWTGIQQARQEAAAFREVFAKPEEARAAAERSRALQEIDAAFYGGAGKPPEETSAARAALAQRLMREDPAAFREMVFAGLRALEEAGTAAPGQRVGNAAVHVPSAEAARQTSQDSSPSLGMTEKEQAAAGTAAQDAHVAAYRTFEKAANEDLDRSVGSAISRAVSQALPIADRSSQSAVAGARRATPVQERLSAAIREDIEGALKADRQLGEQVAQVLASRRFDSETRAQVVRLINDRAQQFVPAAAKRVINEWTQTTLAAHRSKTQNAESAAAHTDLAPAGAFAAVPRLQSGQTRQPSARKDSLGKSATRVDYRKLSDEQILEL